MTLLELLTLIGTPIPEWYVVKCESKNRHQKDMCLREMEQVHAQNLILILGSTININWKNSHDHSMRKRMFTLIMNKVLTLELQQFMRKMNISTILIR